MRVADAAVAAMGPLQALSLRLAVLGQARMNVWHGAVRSGKTFASMFAFVIWLLTRCPSDDQVVVIGRTVDTVGRNLFDPLAQWLPHGAVDYTRGANTASICGRLVHVIGASDSRSEGRIRGMTVAGAYVDEATLLPEAFWKQLLARMSVPGAKLFATTNPDAPKHWLKKDYLDKAGHLSLLDWQFGLEDNPSLGDAYRQQLAAELTGMYYQRYYLGLWAMAEGAIFPQWDEARHVVASLPDLRGGQFWAGVDDGTTNPFAAIALQLGVDDRLYVTSELRNDAKDGGRTLTDVDKSRMIRDWLPERPLWLGVDPAAASLKAQLRRDRVPAVVNAPNDVARGLAVMGSLLSLDRLRVHASATGLIGELPGYVWDPKAALHGEDKPVKEADHSVDAYRYAVMVARRAWRPWLKSVVLSDPAGSAAIELGELERLAA
jgi:PBSX family phage terminase large subunit